MSGAKRNPEVEERVQRWLDETGGAGAEAPESGPSILEELRAEGALDADAEAMISELRTIERALREAGAPGEAASNVSSEGEFDAGALLTGIFDGVDAGLYDDDFDATAAIAPDPAEEEALAIMAGAGLGPSGAVAAARASASPHASAAELASDPPGVTTSGIAPAPRAGVVRALPRIVQGLAAAAAVLLVVTVGWQVTNTGQPEAMAPVAQVVTSTSAPATPEAAEEMAPEPEPSPSPGLGANDAIALAGSTGGEGYAAQRNDDEGELALSQPAQASAPTPTRRARSRTGSAGAYEARSGGSGVGDLRATGGMPTSAMSASRSPAPSREQAAAEALAPELSPPAPPSEAPPRSEISPRALVATWSRCVEHPRDVRLHVDPRSGALRVDGVAGASRSERVCLDRIAARYIFAPAHRAPTSRTLRVPRYRAASRRTSADVLDAWQ